jgi:hypothetical protein
MVLHQVEWRERERDGPTPGGVERGRERDPTPGREERERWSYIR